MKKLLLLLLLISFNAAAEPTLPATELYWIAPTTDANGDPLTDLAGYRIYCGNASGNYTLLVDIGNPNRTSELIADTGLNDGDWFCAMTAYDTSDNESPYSNEINLTVIGGVSPVSGVPGSPTAFGIR